MLPSHNFPASKPLTFLAACLIARVYFLLQYNTVHTCFQQCKDQTRLPFQLSQAIKDVRSRCASHCIEKSSKLFHGVSRHAQAIQKKLAIVFRLGFPAEIPSSCCPLVFHTHPTSPVPKETHLQRLEERR